jgi:hypothetical protein
MAKYRPVYMRIWKDPYFEDYSPSMKLIFLYLCTNELTTESGIYSISTKTISRETGVPDKTVRKLLSNGLKNVRYDFDNNCVFIKNFLKYNGGGRPELLRKSIANNYNEFRTPLWDEFINRYPDYSNGLQTVGQPFNSISNSISNSNKGDSKGENKRHVAEFVTLTLKEYQALKSKYGKVNTKKFIKKLDNYKGANGKKYKSDYRAILNWVIDEVLNSKQELQSIGKKYERVI